MSANETQDTICDWAELTFGISGSDFRVAGRANEELAEAVRAVSAGKPLAEVAVELADTMIVLCRLGRRLGFTLIIGVYPELPLELPRAVASANGKMAVMIEQMVNGAEPHYALQELWRELTLAIQACATTAPEVIDAKMAINRGREWKRDGTGHGYHVRNKH